MSIKLNGKKSVIFVAVIAAVLALALLLGIVVGYVVAQNQADALMSAGGITTDLAQEVAFDYVAQEYAKGGSFRLTKTDRNIYIIPTEFSLRNAFYVYEFKYYISVGDFEVDVIIDSRNGEVKKAYRT